MYTAHRYTQTSARQLCVVTRKVNDTSISNITDIDSIAKDFISISVSLKNLHIINISLTASCQLNVRLHCSTEVLWVSLIHYALDPLMGKFEIFKTHNQVKPSISRKSMEYEVIITTKDHDLGAILSYFFLFGLYLFLSCTSLADVAPNGWE